MPIGLRNAFHRLTRHEERFENAAFHHRYTAGLDALVVVGVGTGQIGIGQAAGSGVEENRKLLGENRLADFLLEGLSVVGLLLPLAFHAMAEDLMEEDTAGAAREDR